MNITSAQAQIDRFDDLASLRLALARALVRPRHDARWEFDLLGHRMRIDHEAGGHARSHDAGLVLSARLRFANGLDAATTEHACRLALPNLRHFGAIAAVDAQGSSVCFIECLTDASTSSTTRALEQMVNQIETWRRLLGPEPSAKGRR